MSHRSAGTPPPRRARDDGGDTALRYKVVELPNVTDQDLEEALNTWTARGWAFESVHFAMRESSKRPAMAFVTFTRSGPGED